MAEDAAAAQKDPVLDFLQKFTLGSMRLKQDKWHRLIISDEMRNYITNFVERPTPQVSANHIIYIISLVVLSFLYLYCISIYIFRKFEAFYSFIRILDLLMRWLWFRLVTYLFNWGIDNTKYHKYSYRILWNVAIRISAHQSNKYRNTCDRKTSKNETRQTSNKNSENNDNDNMYWK